MKKKISLSIVFLNFLVPAGAAFASSDGELIISCQGSLVDHNYDSPPIFGKKIELSISQSSKPRPEYHWIIDVNGDTSLKQPSNGPINSDGTTISKNGEEHSVFFQTPSDGIVLRMSDGKLSGALNYMMEHPERPENWFVVEYVLECKLSGASINQQEATFYNAKTELSNFMDQKNTWFNGVGVVPSETLSAVGLLVFSQDEAQKEKFIAEFKRRGLLVEQSQQLLYVYKMDDGKSAMLPISFEITGDITPNP